MKVRMTIILILLCSVLATSAESARADQSLDSNAHAEMMIVMNRLLRTKFFPHIWTLSQQNPHYSMGALNFSEMFEKIAKVGLYENTTAHPLQVDPERDSDFYLTGQFLGLFNVHDFAAHSNESKVVLSLHVLLGAAGYEDENYQLSLAILLLETSLGQNPNAAFLKNVDFTKLFPQRGSDLYRSFDTIAKRGGFTGIGGGGDIASVQIKLELIQYAVIAADMFKGISQCETRWKNLTTYLADVLSTEIESSSSLQVKSQLVKAGIAAKIFIPKLSAGNSAEVSATTRSVLTDLCLAKGSLQ